MEVLLIALGAGVGFLVAYHTYGKWLGSKIFGQGGLPVGQAAAGGWPIESSLR